MSQITANFRRGWPAPPLPGYREGPGTYGFFDHDTLPPIEQTLNGDFSWLAPLDEPVARAMAPHWQSDHKRTQISRNIERILNQVTTQGLTVPHSFVRFMRSEALHKSIPSCTACYFDAPEQIVEAPPPGNGILIRFMNDQQWCVLWHLYIEKNGAHAVLASDRAFDVEDDTPDSEGPLLVLCADDFETFLYRFWIENTIWFPLYEKHRPLRPVEQRYLDHYRK